VCPRDFVQGASATSDVLDGGCVGGGYTGWKKQSEEMMQKLKLLQGVSPQVWPGNHCHDSMISGSGEKSYIN